MANPMPEFKETGCGGGFVISMSAFSFYMKLDSGLDLFEKQTRNTSENSGMVIIKSGFLLFFFLQFKTCSFNIIHVYEFNFSNFFYIVQTT
jgi:hypothetical protein